MTIHLPDWTRGIHHDSSEAFVTPALPQLGDTVQFQLRTPADAPINGIYMRAMINGEFSYQAMNATPADGHQVWTVNYVIKQRRFDYLFMLMTDVGAIYYHARGASFADVPDSDDFTVIADYDAPLWVRDAVYYQIFPERFANGDSGNDVQDGEIIQRGYPSKKRTWGEPPLPWKQSGSMDFFGGDLNGITQKLDYLEALGITGIYTTPVFEAESNHKYDITNFFKVDSHFGGEEALIELREASRQRQMSLMLDITTNHCSYNNPWVTDFHDHIDGNTAEFFFYDEENDVFETWLGVPSLIKLNYSSEKLRDVMYRNKNSAVRKWLEAPYSIDGWRLDVANMTGNQDRAQLDHEVWRELRAHARESNADVYLLGEYFQDGTAHLQGDELDAGMNYQGFNMPMRRWLVSADKPIPEDSPYAYKPRIPAEVMADQWQIFMASVPYTIALQQFNQLDSHDTSRILHETGGDKALVQLGTALMLGFPGVPCIYYGTEIGMDGGHDPDNRRCMPWDESEWDQNMLAYFRQIIAIRKGSHALKHGGFKVLIADGDLIAFARESQQEQVIVIGYRGTDRTTPTAINVAQIGSTDGTHYRDLLTDDIITVTEGRLHLPMLAHGQTLYLRKIV
ncbi:MAG: alpha-amylase family glycosyl hydrolase [Anaerolineae bacterium]